MSRRHQLANQMAVLPPSTLTAAAPSSSPRFLDAEGFGHGDELQAIDPGLSKRRKAQRYRDLTCPRTRTSVLSDGTKIVTVGSHVLVYPAVAGGAPEPKEGAAQHPKSKAAAAGAVTTFEEHDIATFADDSFKHYSLGVGLYFKGLRFLAWVFLVCSIIVLPSIILSLLVNPTGSESGLYLEKTSVGNFGSLLTLNSTKESTWGDLPSSFSKDQLVLVLSCLDGLTCVILFCFGIWLNARQETESRAYSKREITVRKYSVEVRNLPLRFHDRLKLATWFSERFGQVVDCAITFDQHDLLSMYRSRGIIRKDIDMAVSHGETSRLDHLYDQLARIDNKIHGIQQDLPHRRTLGAYITFEHQESRIACEKAFANRWLKTIARRLKAGGENVDEKKSLLFGKGQRVLDVRQAPEPSNIIFKNVKYSPRNKLARRFTTFLLTGVLILVSVIAVYFAQNQQANATTRLECRVDISEEDVEADDSLTECFCYNLGTARALDAQKRYGIDCSEWLTKYVLARGLSILSVLTIVFVNFILKLTIKSLTQFEKHHSLTRQQESITNKLFVGLFLNTAIVLLVVNMQFQHYATNLGFEIAFDGKYEDFVFSWYVHVGASIMLTMILNTVNPHLLPFMKVPWRRWRREGKLCGPTRSHSQSVWNARYAGEDFELAERYAVLLNTIFVTLLYSGGMPLLLPIAAVTFALTYVMDKVSFLRLYRIPPRFDHSLAMYTTTLLPYAIFLHLAFTLWSLSAPLLHDDALSAVTPNTISNYRLVTVTDRVTHWSTLPTLVLLVLVGAFIVVFRWCRGIYVACTDANSASDLNLDASKFVPYSVARRTVTLETFHPHGSPYWHDAFIRTPSRKMMKIPTPLHVLQEQARVAALKKQQTMVEKQAYNQANGVAPAAMTLAPPVGLDADEVEDRPGLDRAASMGINSSAVMQAPPEVIAKQREIAKAEATRNKATWAKKGGKVAAAATSSSAASGIVKALSEIPESVRHPPPAEYVEADDAASSGVVRPAASPTARPSKKLPKAASSRATDSPLRATPRGDPEPIVILDIPSEQAEHMQRDVEAALDSPDDGLKSPSPGLDASPPPRPYTSHLQHHAHISLPTEDPLLPEVTTQLHRMARTLETAPGEVNRATAKPKPKERKKEKRTKTASVHDSSNVPTLGEEHAIDVPEQQPSPPPRAESVSLVATDTDSEAAGDAQLVPTACPNIECGRVLELVDTGVPQLYHCPFCACAFLM